MKKHPFIRPLVTALGFIGGIAVLNNYGWLWFAGFVVVYTALLSYLSQK